MTMRRVNRTNEFKRDFKRHSRGKYRDALLYDLPAIIQTLAIDQPLSEKNHDHELGGSYRGLRKCHIKPDLLLIYEKQGGDILILISLGTHSELFG